MQTEGRGEAARKDPLLSNTIHHSLDPRRDCESDSVHSISPHSSPQAEELNQVAESSPASLSAAGALRSPYVAPPPHRNQHISGEPNTNMHASSNPIAHVKARQPYSPHMQTSSSGPLSPVPAGKVTAVNTVYTPLRLDSQLLGSSWTGAHQPQPIASPTRAGAGPGGAAYSSYWNVATSPAPYPCGSPTAYSSGLRTMSPSMHSLRHHPQQQSQHPQQQLLNNDGSPMQLSISTPGRESSFISTMPTYTSPSATGMLHTAILDAPLQLSLVPPTCGDDYPYFSFGNSILQSTPYTPTVQTPTARSYSIYHDTVRELAQQRTEMDNPLSLFQSDNSRHHGHDGSPASLSGGAISSASLTPLTVDVAVQLPNLPPRAVSEVSFASVCGAIVPPKIVDGTLVDWTKLGQMSPPSPRLPEPLTARPTTDTDAAAHHGPRGAAQEDEDDAEGSNRSSRNSTPDEEEVHDGAESAAVSPNVAVSDGVPMPFGALGSTQRPHKTATPSSGPDQAVSGRETRNVAALSLSDPGFAFRELESRQAAGTPSPEQGKSGSGLRVSVSAVAHPRRQGTQPSSPGVAPPGAMLQLGVPDLHLFMPSPLDEGAGGFAPLRDGLTGYSPSEHSVSALSLVPHLGMWHASPALLSAHSPAPSVRAALGDLAEVLRLLQSDVSNVYGRVSSNEHTVRHWASCTLDALLRLTVELLHSVRRSAEDEVVTREAAPEDGLNYTVLYDEVRKWADGCGDALRATIPAAQRDHDKLEPLLLTSMLARGSIQALLRSLERPYIADDGAAARADASHDPATAPAATATTIPASRRISPALPAPSPLTNERVDELMDSEVLARELGGEWRQFASDYNRKLLRYLFLRVLYKRLSGKDRHTSGADSSADVHVDAADATERHGSPATSARGGSGVPSTLRTIESAWAEDQLKRWSAIMQRFQLRAECKGNVPPSEEAAPVDEATLQLLREALCHDFPSYDVVSTVFPTFHKGESWRRWYILLDRTMECTFHAQEQKELFAYVARQFLTSPSAPATAALHAASNGQITLEQVEEALEKVEASLKALEEQGKARRVAILQLLLRRIFVLSVVSSVHRAAGKDAVVSNAQLATYVQVQRKSLEEVETQLAAEYAEAETQATTIRAFLSHMATVPRDLATGSESPMNGASHTQLHPGTATSPVQSSDAQWNTATVGAIGSLLARARFHSGTMDRNDETDDSGCSDEDGSHRHMQDGMRLVEDVTTRVVESIGSLCALLQSDVDLKDVKRGYDVAPTKLPIPSTRALRRLQTSLSETHRAMMVASAALHTD